MINMNDINFNAVDGLIPACVQDYQSMRVLMIGYMNQEALQQTLALGYVTFYSRSKQRLWTKGETSGNRLKLISLSLDCDRDALLIFTENKGPTCHQGTVSCFADAALPPLFWLAQLNAVIASRANAAEADSYTKRLLISGIPRIAQKIGEEGVEVALAAVVENDASLAGEVVDLLYHVLVLLQARAISFETIADMIRGRNQVEETRIC